MSGISIARVVLSLSLRLSEGLLNQHLVSSPKVLGRQLADQIDDHVRTHDLGYYPPLEYFVRHAALDADLLKVEEETGWMVCRFARELLNQHLRPAFSSIEIRHIQPVAFTMPRVRPRETDAITRLAAHFTPNVVKVTLVVSSIERRVQAEAVEKMAQRKIWRWLQDHFDGIDVVSAKLA
jgi:hypothetical protein